jgi:hypothetical protein
MRDARLRAPSGSSPIAAARRCRTVGGIRCSHSLPATLAVSSKWWSKGCDVPLLWSRFAHSVEVGSEVPIDVCATLPGSA